MCFINFFYGIAELVYGSPAASGRDLSYELPDFSLVNQALQTRQNMTLASRLIDSRELSLVEIRDILGHNDSQTTLNYYGFAVGSEKERADSITSALKAVGFEEMVSKSTKMVSKSTKVKSPGTLIK